MSPEQHASTPSPAPDAAPTDAPTVDDPIASAARTLSRRGFLRAATLAGGGAMAAGLAACSTAAAPAWSFGPAPSPGAPTPGAPTPAAPTPAPTLSPTAAPASPTPVPTSSLPPLPPGWTEHDLNAQIRVRRFVGKLAPALGISDILDDPLGPSTDEPEYTKVTQGNQPLEPTIDGDTKVFRMSVDEMDWVVDAQMPPLKAFGYNGTWPGPRLQVTEGDKVRVEFTNNLEETTSVHFHGLEPADFRQDGVAFVTQRPFGKGETFTYEFVAKPSGSHMYHSHHNATDQVGRGLLGAFIVDPADPKQRYPEKYGTTQDVVFIHNDALGGFTINGHAFPSTTPIVAKLGERILIRYMNEGLMMHPWHTHGFRQHVVARDGHALGSASFYCDTLGVNPGERYDAIVEADRVGVWAFHCHILSHVEGLDGMFGMVTALVVLPS